MDMNNGVGIAWARGFDGWVGAKENSWDNYNSLINKI